MVEPDSPEPRLTPDNDSKQTTRKRTSASRAKKGQEDNAAPDAPGEKKNVRATREDKGIPRLEERDLIAKRLRSWSSQRVCPAGSYAGNT